MPNNNPVFVFDGKLCKFEGMTKEQIINAIAEATGVTPSDVDAGFISTLVEQNKNRSIHIWKGTRAEYNALALKEFGTLYVIDDDTTIEDLTAVVQNCDAEIDEMREDVQALDTGMTEAKSDIEGLESDMTEAQGDIQALEAIFAFSGGLNGFTILKNKYNGNVVKNIPLPSAGLYILHIGDRSGQGRDGHYSSCVMYWDGQNESCTSEFAFEYWNGNLTTPSYSRNAFSIRIDEDGNSYLCKGFSSSETTECQSFQINYRKIG